MVKITTTQIAIAISMIALLISSLHFYFGFIRKGEPKFICSSFTALGMEGAKGDPKIVFAAKIRAINDGKRPLVLKDIVLVARHNSEAEVIKYEPIMLFDFQQYIEHQGKADRIGRSQKGQVTLPMAIPADESHDFAWHLLFLPIDKVTAIQPLKTQIVEIEIYALTNRSSKYKLIGKQVFPVDKIKDIRMGDFTSVISDQSIKERGKFFKKFKW